MQRQHQEKVPRAMLYQSRLRNVSSLPTDYGFPNKLTMVEYSNQDNKYMG